MTNSFIGWIVFLFLLILANLFCLISRNGSQPPNIVLIYADDLGWNDISFHGSPQIPTPNIDSLALNGITLQNYYGEWVCTPSRGALLTGKYPIRLGLQHCVILAGQAIGLPLNETTLPQRLKKFGYESHLIGKWHLGYQTKEYTPTYRGFDSFFGFWNAHSDYFDHTYLEDTVSGLFQPFFGLDFRDNMAPVVEAQGKYATHLFTERAGEIIKKHDTSKPLFLFFSHLAVHSGNTYQKSQAPGDTVSQFAYIKDLGRRIHAGVVKEMDDSVGSVFKALHERDMLGNTVFLFVSDNGGEVDPQFGFGSNYPLRGNKHTQWEGAIRIPAVIWSPLLKLDKPRISRQLMHVSDWLPTLYKLAGGILDDLGSIDGFDMWQAITEDTPSPRTNMLQNLDPLAGTWAYRQGNLKLINGTLMGADNFWHGPSSLEGFNITTIYEWVFKNGSIVKDILQEMELWIVKDPNQVYQDLILSCEQPQPEEAFLCDPSSRPCLFNITDDPCEYYDLAGQYPETVNEMLEVIHKYQLEQVKIHNPDCDPSANPICHQFLFDPWLDPDYYHDCDLK